MKKCWIMLIGTAAMSAYAGGMARINTTDAYLNSSWTNAYMWTDSETGNRLGNRGAAIPTDYDYLVANSRTCRTPLQPATFPGKSLTVGELGDNGAAGNLTLYPGTTGVRYTFAGEGLTLVRGRLQNLAGRNPRLAGNIKVTAPASAPFWLNDHSAGSALWFEDAVFSGEADAGVQIATWDAINQYNFWTATNTTCHFAGDMLKDFKGEIICSQFVKLEHHTNDTFHATLSSGTVETPARVTLYPYGVIKAEAATDVVSVASLTVKDKGCIGVTYDDTLKTGSCIVVRNTFTREGKVTIRFSPGFRYATDSTQFVPEFPVLKVPAGTTLNLDDFVLDSTCLFPDYDLRVGTDGEGLPTLYLGQTGQVVVQSQKDSNSNDQYNYKNYGTFFSGNHWSDGLPPDPTNFYYSTLEMRSYDPAKPDPVLFGGRVLARNGGPFELQTGNNAVTHIADLRFVGESHGVIYDYASTPRRLTGRIRCWFGADDRQLIVYGNDARFLDIASDIEGWGIISAKLTNSKTSWVRLSGNNTNFTGTIRVESDKSGTGENFHLEFSCPDERSLGGPMPKWTYNGHAFRHHSVFTPDGTMTLNRKNCGLYLEGTATFNVTNGTLTVLERMAWRGHLTKKGTGTFALGGERPTFVTSTSYTPVADTNVLIVAEGSLKPLSAAAFDGVAVTMASGTSLALDVPANFTADIGKYGMALTNALAGLTLPAEGVTVTLANPSGAALRSCVVPICTVATTAADALDGKFNCASGHPFAGYSATITRTDNSDGTTTFGVALVRGTTLFIR